MLSGMSLLPRSLLSDSLGIYLYFIRPCIVLVSLHVHLASVQSSLNTPGWGDIRTPGANMSDAVNYTQWIPWSIE